MTFAPEETEKLEDSNSLGTNNEEEKDNKENLDENNETEDNNNETIKEVENFLSEVQPEEEMKNYINKVLKICTNYLDEIIYSDETELSIL